MIKITLFVIMISLLSCLSVHGQDINRSEQFILHFDKAIDYVKQYKRTDSVSEKMAKDSVLIQLYNGRQKEVENIKRLFKVIGN